MAAITLTSLSSGASVPNWQLVTSNAPTGVTTVTFSGLAGYSKYRVIGKSLTATNVNVILQLNGDSGTNYSYFGTQTSAAAVAGIFNTSTATSIAVAATAASCSFSIDIEHSLLLIPKVVQFSSSSAASYATVGSGIYQTTSQLSSITIATTAGSNYSAGTIYLLGAN